MCLFVYLRIEENKKRSKRLGGHMNFTVSDMVQSWRESVAMFSPHAIKVFMLITLNAYKEMWRSFFVGAWWYCLLCAGIGVEILRGKIPLTGEVIALLYALFVFFIICALRPSIDIKRSFYFFKMFLRYGSWWIVCLLLGWFVWKISGAFFIYTLFIIFLTWEVITLFFILDSGGDGHKIFLAPWNSLEMVGYNIPFVGVWLCVSIGFSVLYWYIQSLEILSIQIAFLFFLLILMIPLYLALLINVYSMKIHQQFNVYYEEL